MNEYFRDEWPTMPDGSSWDGTQLLSLVQSGKSPFHPAWDVKLLIQEVEREMKAKVIDIPIVSNGSNNYGFHIRLSDQRDIIARLARGDVNMPHYSGFPIKSLVSEVEFEAAVYDLLREEPVISVSLLHFYRVPLQSADRSSEIPRDILGRRLMIFTRGEGESNSPLWKKLDAAQIRRLLDHAAHVRATLFNYKLPEGFASKWFLDRLFEHKPKSLPFPVQSTRDFCMDMFTLKIQATIGEVGDMIGWEEDNETVGPIAFAAKHSLLQLIPHIFPLDDSLYRLVLDHLDYGIHNMLITRDTTGSPSITSVFDWETACVVPAILSDPLMAVKGVDLSADGDGRPLVSRLSKDEPAAELERYASWSRCYATALFENAPNYLGAIKAGKDARHLWFALREWRGEDPEGYFGSLGTWANARIAEINAS